MFRNQAADQLATKIPISGVDTNSTVDVMSTIGTLLRNAFIRALLPKYDQQITAAEVAKMVQAGRIPNATTNGVAKTNNFERPFSETNKPASLLEMPVNSSGTNRAPAIKF